MCNYLDGNTGSDCSNFSNVTFEFRCYYNVAIFEDRDFILSNYTFGSWFLVRVPESRCDLNDDTFKDRCYYNVDTFEVCHCTDGHQEDTHCLNHGQGVYKTPGEAPTTISGKRSGQIRDQGLLQVMLQWLQHGQAQKRLTILILPNLNSKWSLED